MLQHWFIAYVLCLSKVWVSGCICVGICFFLSVYVCACVCRYGLCVCSFHRYPRLQYRLHADLQCRIEEQATYLPCSDPAWLRVWSDVGGRWYLLVYCQWHIVTTNQLSYHHLGEHFWLFLFNTSFEGWDEAWKNFWSDVLADATSDLNYISATQLFCGVDGL